MMILQNTFAIFSEQ